MAWCEHPYDKLMKTYKGQRPNTVHLTVCTACGDTPLGSADDFDQLREDAYRDQVGWPIRWKDFLGNEIKVGSIVVYPVMSGRSAQIAEGVVQAINPPTTGDSYYRGGLANRIDAPQRLKIMPTGRSARWEQYYSGRYGDKVQKAVTLSANAASVVVVGDST